METKRESEDAWPDDVATAYEHVKKAAQLLNSRHQRLSWILEDALFLIEETIRPQMSKEETNSQILSLFGDDSISQAEQKREATGTDSN